MQLNNQTVEYIDLCLPEASTILNLVSFSGDYSRSSASIDWALKQNFEQVDDANVNVIRNGVCGIVDT